MHTASVSSSCVRDLKFAQIRHIFLHGKLREPLDARVEVWTTLRLQIAIQNYREQSESVFPSSRLAEKRK